MILCLVAVSPLPIGLDDHDWVGTATLI
uniref:Uncharacterized protein n=1 Tax=Arundo donax TaxID=35708 RepID=A0A0A9BM00_ARUDO